jgi:hypothetical protein
VALQLALVGLLLGGERIEPPLQLGDLGEEGPGLRAELATAFSSW